MNPDLQRELDRRRQRGYEPVSMRQLKEQLAELGYKLDRTMDSACRPRYVSGPNAGESYPSVILYVREIDSGLSFAHVDARRDVNFETLQRMRFEGALFSVVRGRLMEI